jgi:hypothetical protein
MNRITLITLGSVFAACSSSTNQATPEQYDATAQAIATTTASSGSGGGGDVASMADSVNIALGTVPVGLSLQGSGHYQGSRLGLDYSYAITCKSLAGTTLSVCDHTTNQATVDVSWSGSISSGGLDVTTMRDGTWTITGLQTDTATFSGDSSLSFDVTLTSGPRTATYSFDASASYDAIRISTQQRQVIDGSATFDLTAHSMVTGAAGNSSATFAVNATITFHADHTASLVLDGTQHYTLDLATGAVVKAS